MKWFHWLLIVLHTALAFACAGHALLSKRDPRAAMGWIGVCLVFPLAGPALYFLFGINRVRTRARQLVSRPPFRLRVGYERAEPRFRAITSQVAVPPEARAFARISDAITGRSLSTGNRVDVLHNGEEAYPAMLDAIAGASARVHLSTYIFETNRTGRRFIDVLSQAVRRGVDVRVLIDGIGEWYSVPRAGVLLKRAGVRVARFLPPRIIPPALHINLRNHRKMLTVDGQAAFTGGMNIGDRHLAASANPRRVVDMHFRLCGPVVEQIEDVFYDDWRFVTGETLAPVDPIHARHGDAMCRTITDGPNEDLDQLAAILVGAVSAAEHRIGIMTPYFLPSRELISALQSAALRGVEVTIVLPGENNLPVVHWATRNLLWELLQHGVRVYYQPPPFAHTKLFVVDDHYTQIGSANLDPRSLRLNFELAVEVYERAFARCVLAHIDAVRGRSREVSLVEVDGRSVFIRARDAAAWLFSPYL